MLDGEGKLVDVHKMLGELVRDGKHGVSTTGEESRVGRKGEELL
jgi:hypothetical protein